MKPLNAVTYSVILALLCSAAYSLTTTFDSLTPGSDPSYSVFENVLVMFDGFAVEDHSEASWGSPHSGNIVLVGQDYYNSAISWKGVTPGRQPLMNSISAYFSTQEGVVMRMDCYNSIVTGSAPVASATIGAEGESWNDRYVELNATDPFWKVVFSPIGQLNPQLYFSMDDLKLTPVPEPSSVAVLGAGLLPLGFSLRRRRRNG